MAKRTNDSELLWPDNISDDQLLETMQHADRRELARFVSIVLQKQFESKQSGLVTALGDDRQREDRGAALK